MVKLDCIVMTEKMIEPEICGHACGHENYGKFPLEIYLLELEGLSELMVL